MFHADRWTEAFFTVSGENADEVFLCLKAVVPRVKHIHGAFFGRSASAIIERMLRESAGSAGITENSFAVEYAFRFTCLLIEKNCFKHVDLIMARIEQILDERKGILDVTVESAFSMDNSFEKDLTQTIKERTGAAGVKMKTCVKPELLGGYLLRIGSFYIDASLKRQLENLMTDLNQAARLAHGGVL